MKTIKRLAATSVIALATLLVLGAALVGATPAAAPAVAAAAHVEPVATLDQSLNAYGFDHVGHDESTELPFSDGLVSAPQITPAERTRLDGLMAIWLQVLPSELVDSFRVYLDELAGASAAN